MGAWIEITKQLKDMFGLPSRTPRWVRGLKLLFWLYGLATNSRTPRWVRGLKLHGERILHTAHRSHPTMGAWIEILGRTFSLPRIYGRTPRWVRGLK